MRVYTYEHSHTEMHGYSLVCWHILTTLRWEDYELMGYIMRHGLKGAGSMVNGIMVKSNDLVFCCVVLLLFGFSRQGFTV